MLEYIRSSAQSFGVKLAFGVIILVFVFWGIGNFNDRDYSNVVAVVNGEPIVAMEFEKAYQNAEEYIMRNNPGITREQLIRDHLGRRVLRDMIQSVLLAQEAAKAGVAVSPLELRREAEKIKAFQNENGKFDPEIYKRVLAARHMTPAQYEKQLGNELLQEKMFELLTAPVWIDPGTAERMFNFLREKRVANYMFIPAARFADDASVDETEARSWYDGHKERFAIPPAVEAEYIVVRPEALVRKEDLSEKDARAWYDANLRNFAAPERVRASHILVPLAPDADDAAFKEALERLEQARSQLDSGVPFAKVADGVNQAGAAGSGGELGWLNRGETVPPFEEAVFDLEPGEISGAIRTPFGLHIVQVQEKEKGGVRSFDEVKDAAYAALAFEAGSEKIQDVLDSLVEDNILNKPLSESAEKYGLKAERSAPLDKNGLMEKLGVSAEDAASLLATPANAPLDTALNAGENYIVARVVSSVPEGTKPFAEVRGEIETALKAEKALKMAMEQGEEFLKKFKTESFKEVASQNRILESEPIDRGDVIKGFEPNEALSVAIFETSPGEWLPTVYEEKNGEGPGALLARVEKSILPDAKEFAEASELLTNAAKQSRRQAMFEFFMNGLSDGAKIEITNQNLVDRAGS